MISPELLRRYPFFGGLSDTELKSLAMISEEAEFAKDEFLIREGEDADTLYLILEGDVCVMVRTDGEDELSKVTPITAGQIVGWSAVVPPYKYTAYVRANSDVKAVAIDGPGMRAMFEMDHDFGYLMLSKIVEIIRSRLSDTRIQLASIEPEE